MVLTIVGAFGQNLRVVKPKQTVNASPVATPEPRFRVQEDPSLIFEQLINSSGEIRRRGIVALEWKDQENYAEDPTFIGDARFYRVNLDDEPDPEAILMLNIGLNPTTRVLIFKKTDHQWWCIGDFSLSYMWEPDAAEHMVELRNIIDIDHKDIIIRLIGGGSDIQKDVELAIYRIHAGRLYRTFGMTQEFAVRRFPAPGVMMIDDECNEISYPERMRGGDAYIVVRSTKRTVPEAEWGIVDTFSKTAKCVPYRWDPVKYIFVADTSASSKFCSIQNASPVRHR